MLRKSSIGSELFRKVQFFVEISQRVRNNGSVEGVSILDGILNVGIAIEPQTQPLRQP